MGDLVVKERERKDLDWKDPLTLAMVGVLTLVYGYGRILRGKWIYTNWRGLDLSAQFVIFLGLLLLIAAVFPWGRIRLLWQAGKKQRK